MKRKLISISVLFLFTLFNSFGQSFWKTYEFQGESENEGVSIEALGGGFLIIGTAPVHYISSQSHLALALVRTNESGDTLWTKIINENDLNNCSGYSGQATFDDGFIISGLWDLTDGFLLKLDSLGNIQWNKCIKNSSRFQNYSMAWPPCIQTHDSGFVILNFDSSNSIFSKVDAYGNFLWTKRISCGSINLPSGCILETSDNGFILPLNTDTTLSHGASKMVILKLDSQGNLLWNNGYSMGGGTFNRNIYETSDSGFIFCDGLNLIKTDSLGNISWMRGYNVNFGLISSFVNVNQGYLLCGSPDSNGTFIIRCDLSGNVLWTKRFIHADYYPNAQSINPTNDGGFIISGTSSTPPFYDNFDFFLIKIDSNANIYCSSDTSSITILNPPITPMNFIVTIDSISPIVTSPNIVVHYGVHVTTLCLSTGLQSVEEEIKFNISPNPSSGKFHLQNIDTEFNISIYNIFGRVIFNSFRTTINSEIDLSNLPKGIYICKVISRGNQVSTSKIVLQ